MFIVDSQVHIWAEDSPERPWPVYAGKDRPNPPHLAQPLTAEKLLCDMDALGIARAVLIPPSWEGCRNDQVLAAAQRYPTRFRAVGRLDIEAADAPDRLAGWLGQPGMLGLQLTFQKPPFEDLLTQGKADWIWPIAERAGIPINVYLEMRNLHYIERAAQRHPGLRFLINHCALAGPRRDDAAFEEFDKLLALARQPNIAVKASCLQFYTTQSYPFPLLEPYMRRLFDAFGPRRMFWGTDLSRLPVSWRQAIDFFVKELPWLSAEDKEWVMGRALCEWQHWPLPEMERTTP